MVHHVGWRGFEDVQSAVVAATKVGHQNFNLRAGRERAGAADAVDKMLTAAIAQIVAVHAGDDHIFQLQGGNGFGQVFGLIHIQRVGAAVADVTKRAATGAFVAHDHEGGRAFAKAFTNVGAGSFFAHRHQFVGTQHVFDFIKTRAGRACFDANPIGFFEHFALFDLDRNARQLGRRFLFGRRVVGLDRLRFAHNIGF